MSYDKGVWTGEDVPIALAERWFHWSYEINGRRIARLKQGAELLSLEPVELRSILPIPSAEEIAALVECEKAAKGLQVRLDAHFGGPKHSIDWLEQERLRAALARLDAARKEQGK